MNAPQDARVSTAQAAPRAAIVIYWVSTLFITVTGLSAGVGDLLHLQPLFGTLLHLGYPSYFAQVLGAVALLVPRRPLVKEWAYAGLFIDYSSAVISHAAVGDGVVAMVGPLVSIGAMATSWLLRPGDRRLPRTRTEYRMIGS